MKIKVTSWHPESGFTHQVYTDIYKAYVRTEDLLHTGHGVGSEVIDGSALEKTAWKEMFFSFTVSS